MNESKKGDNKKKKIYKQNTNETNETQTFLEIFLFLENLACFVFLLPPFWDSRFCLITVEFTTQSLTNLQ